MTHKKLPRQAWVVTVDMGYGHQRAVHPLRYLACEGIISANDYPGIPEQDKKLWHQSRTFYEFISRFKKVPFIGEKAFALFDRLQEIPEFYPRRDLSRPNIQVKQIYRLFKTGNWGRHLIKKLAKKPLPIVTSFFVTAMMAEYYKYPGEIYCLATDTDISRAWVPPAPEQSRIIYLAPNKRVEDRLKLYGVKPENIFLTGFPLPFKNVGKNLAVIKKDLGRRLIQLDPKKVFLKQYEKTLIEQLGARNLKKKPVRPLTITFAVGGAGAQRELGITIVQSLKKEILFDKVRINLVAGVNEEVRDYFKDGVKKAGLAECLGRGVKVIFDRQKDDYFDRFDRLLHQTDILWTKPSELSFYCALGLPIITAPPIGSQEVFNQRWLRAIAAGIKQENPKYTHQWLADWLDSGWLAEAAMQGFLEAPRQGTFNVEKIIFHETGKTKKVETVLQF